MDDLIAFVKARLEEDEATAKEACAGPWHTDRSVLPGLGGAWTVDALDGGPVFINFAATDDDVAHVARHDPARVLREVAAKRAIVDDYRRARDASQNATGAELDTPGYAAVSGAWAALKVCVTLLAAAWPDHPDYRQEWKP
jgi:hypothetical protein